MMRQYGGKQMAERWRTVRNHTIHVAQDIPAEQYGFWGALHRGSSGASERRA